MTGRQYFKMNKTSPTWIIDNFLGLPYFECQYFEICKYYDEKRCNYSESCNAYLTIDKKNIRARDVLRRLVEPYVQMGALELQINS